VEELIIRKRSL